MFDEDEDDAIRAAHEALATEGVIEPLSRDEAETRRWLDWELCSLVENRFVEGVDPLAFTAADRARWEPRASSGEPLSSPHEQGYFRRSYWLRDGADRAGTIALGTVYMGFGLLTVSSLYTLPSHRGRGIAGRALRRAHAAVIAHGGRGLRVPAYWTWQPAVRFYLGLGMWAQGWKHAAVFGFEDDLPPHRIAAGDGEARFAVVEGGVETALIEAARAGDRLVWRELPALSERLARRARETFAVALATRGFPLIRSEEAWADRHASSDGGWPEGLAMRIEAWEAWDRRSGYAVRTPRIPGIAYRAWDEIR